VCATVCSHLIFLEVAASGWSLFLATLVLAVRVWFYSLLALDCLAAIRVFSLVFLSVPLEHPAPSRSHDFFVRSLSGSCSMVTVRPFSLFFLCSFPEALVFPQDWSADRFNFQILLCVTCLRIAFSVLSLSARCSALWFVQSPASPVLRLNASDC
jgi:hypothetical protein